MKNHKESEIDQRDPKALLLWELLHFGKQDELPEEVCISSFQFWKFKIKNLMDRIRFKNTELFKLWQQLGRDPNIDVLALTMQMGRLDAGTFQLAEIRRILQGGSEALGVDELEEVINENYQYQSRIVDLYEKKKNSFKKEAAPAYKDVDNYFGILGIEIRNFLKLDEQGKAQIIRAAQRRMAAQHHPDKTGNEDRTMILANEAAQALLSPASLARYVLKCGI